MVSCSQLEDFKRKGDSQSWTESARDTRGRAFEVSVLGSIMHQWGWLKFHLFTCQAAKRYSERCRLGHGGQQSSGLHKSMAHLAMEMRHPMPGETSHVMPYLCHLLVPITR